MMGFTTSRHQFARVLRPAALALGLLLMVSSFKEVTSFGFSNVVLARTDHTASSGEGSQEKRDSVAAGLRGIFRRHGLDASASALGDELLVSVTGTTSTQRDLSLSEYFPTKTQENLCSIGFHKLFISGGGWFGGGKEYRMRCKDDAAKDAVDVQSKSELRKAFAASLRKSLAVSPKIADVEANGRILEITGKNGLDAKTVSSTLCPQWERSSNRMHAR